VACGQRFSRPVQAASGNRNAANSEAFRQGYSETPILFAVMLWLLINGGSNSVVLGFGCCRNAIAGFSNAERFRHAYKPTPSIAF
jgi:hypothetical protein